MLFTSDAVASLWTRHERLQREARLVEAARRARESLQQQTTAVWEAACRGLRATAQIGYAAVLDSRFFARNRHRYARHTYSTRPCMRSDRLRQVTELQCIISIHWKTLERDLCLIFIYFSVRSLNRKSLPGRHSCRYTCRSAAATARHIHRVRAYMRPTIT